MVNGGSGAQDRDGTVQPMTRRVSRFPSVLAALAALTLALPACGENPDGPQSLSTSTTFSARSLPDPGLLHIHGLGVVAGRLFIATHTGMFTAAEGSTKSVRFGAGRQDVMGFTVVGGRRFLGSGHPAPGVRLPPNLGLIRSADAGQTWRQVSLLGQADFHVLESQGSRVYGYDGTRDRLMASSDGGRKWAERSLPPIISLAIDPTDRNRFVASTGQALLGSSNGGRAVTIVPSAPPAAGLLAWPAATALYTVDASGVVRRSRDRGVTWRRTGDVGGEPSAFVVSGSDLYVALIDGTVKRSADGGQSWTVRSRR